MPSRTLQLPEATEFHRRAWLLQRIACALLGLVVLAALLGAFGGGWLSRSSADDGRGMHLEYERVARRDAHTRLDLHLGGDAATTARGTREIRIARTWLEDVRIQSIVPPPRDTLAQAGALHYRFDVQDGEPLRVRIDVEPTRPGRMDLQLAQPDAPPIRVTQYVLP